MATPVPIKAMRLVANDPYICKLCRRNMLDRRPRLLSCHHSYCTFCLSTIQNMHSIKCPECREFTFLLNGDIRQLPIHTLLLRMKKREEELLALPYTVCSICQERKPENKCVECKELFCQGCTSKHNEMELHEDHLILKLCGEHFEGLTQMCKDCTCAVCPKCIYVSHSDHELVDLATGAKLLRAELSSMKAELNNQISNLDKARVREETCVQLTHDMKGELLKRRMRLLEKLVKMDEVLSDIEENYEKQGRALSQTMTQTKEDLKVIVSLLDEKEEEESDIELIYQFLQIEIKVKQAQGEGKKVEMMRYQQPPFKLASEGSENIVIPLETGAKTFAENPQDTSNMPSVDGKEGDKLQNSNVEDIVSIANLQLLFELKEVGGLGFKQPTEVCFLGDDVLICDNGLKCVVQLDPNGNLISKFYPSDMEDELHGISIYNGFLYILQSKTITKIEISKGQDSEKVVLNPGLDMTGSLLVVDETKLVITDAKSKIYEYNIVENKSKIVVDNLRTPTYLSMTKDNQNRRFIVTIQEDHRLHVYDPEWQLLAIVGGLENGESYLLSPQATVVTELGNILVPNHQNNSIRGFDLDGKFLGQIRMEDKAIEWPKGMAYKHPYLYITENHIFHAAVKCFLVPDSVKL